MLAIRLQRIGKKGQPSYRLVVAERRSKLGAPPTEDLGSYDPRTKKANFNADRVTYWIKSGAQPTITTHNLLVREGVLNAPKRRPKIAKPVPKEPVASAEATADKEASVEKPADEPAAAEPIEEVAAVAAEAPAEDASPSGGV